MNAAEAHGLVVLAEEVSSRAYEPDAGSWTGELDARADELRPAATALLDAGEELAALRLVAALRIYAQDSGRVDEVRALADDVLERVAGAEPSTALAGTQLVSGELAFRQGDQAAAGRATESARATAEAAGDPVMQARAEINLARVAFRDAAAERIRTHAGRALELAGDDARVRSGGIHMLGWAAYTSGDTAEAIRLFEQNADLCAERGDKVGTASELANVGDLALESGDVERAAGLLGRALEISVEVNSRYLMPGVLASVAALASTGGRHAEGLELAAAADRQYADAGLTPDPGDGFNDELREAAITAVGAGRAEEFAARGRNRSLNEAIALARSVL